MFREELQQLFCMKIGFEKSRFEKRILKLKSEEIIERCYQIECMSRIHDILKEQSQKMEVEMLERLLVLPNLLANFYERWLHIPDSYHEELEDAVMTAAEEIKNIYQTVVVDNKEQAA